MGRHFPSPLKAERILRNAVLQGIVTYDASGQYICTIYSGAESCKMWKDSLGDSLSWHYWGDALSWGSKGEAILFRHSGQQAGMSFLYLSNTPLL